MNSFRKNPFNSRKFMTVLITTNNYILDKRITGSQAIGGWNETIMINFNQALFNILLDKPMIQYTAQTSY